MNVAFFCSPDGEKTGVLVVSQQTIKVTPNEHSRYKERALAESGRRSPLFVAWARHGASPAN